MTKLSETDIQLLRQIANQLLDLIGRLAGESVLVPEHIATMVEEKTAKRICLACDQVTPENSKYRRGNDDACYATHRARIRRGEVRESQLIADGKMTPEAKTPGRAAKMDGSSSAKIVGRQNAAAAAELLAKARKKKKES
jgi:cob(I)alamin adenosyltransferase